MAAQSAKHLALACRFVFLTKAAKRAVENETRPASLEERVGAQRRVCLQGVAALRIRQVDAKRAIVRAPCQRALTFPLIGEEVLDRDQKERAESSEFRIDVLQEIRLEQAEEKPLGQVLRLIGGVALPADVGEQWVLIRLAEPFEGLPGVTLPPASRQDEAPPGRLELIRHRDDPPAFAPNLTRQRYSTDACNSSFEWRLSRSMNTTVGTNMNRRYRIAGIALLTLLFAASASSARELNLEDRVAAQRAIERVYWNHRLWPSDNEGSKPPLSTVMPDSAIRAKVEDSLRKASLLDSYWHQAPRGEQLQQELDRMVRSSKSREILRELFAALHDDPFLVAECLARPALVEREVELLYPNDPRIHGAQRGALVARLAIVKDLGSFERLAGHREHRSRRGQGHTHLGSHRWRNHVGARPRARPHESVPRWKRSGRNVPCRGCGGDDRNRLGGPTARSRVLVRRSRPTSLWRRHLRIAEQRDAAFNNCVSVGGGAYFRISLHPANTSRSAAWMSPTTPA